jgi:hypothetical protein
LQANSAGVQPAAKHQQPVEAVKPKMVRGLPPQESGKSLSPAPFLPPPEKLGIVAAPPTPEQLGIGTATQRP